MKTPTTELEEWQQAASVEAGIRRVALAENKELLAEIERLRALLNAWLMAGGMTGGDLAKLIQETEGIFTTTA